MRRAARERQPIRYSKLGAICATLTVLLVLLFACDAKAGSITQHRRATRSCQQARYSPRSPVAHAERSHSRAYRAWAHHRWQARQLRCERALAADRKRWKRDPVGHAKQIAKYLLRLKGWSNQFWALDGVIMVESHWHWWADNPISDAYGIPQALPGSKMASHGADWRTNPETQLRWMILTYIPNRYGNPVNAYHHRMANGSY